MQTKLQASERRSQLSPEQRALLERRLRGQGSSAPRGIPPRPPGDTAPLSFAQQRLWLLSQLDPESPEYHISEAFRLEGAFDLAAFEHAIGELVRRHESLRTVFEMMAGQLVQRVLPAPAQPPALPLIDIQTLPPAEQEWRVERESAAELRRPFDLGRDPLWRCTVLRLDAQHHVVFLTLHHIVSDGWSWSVLMRELGALYAAFSAGLASPLPEPQLQYSDFAHWQRTTLAEAEQRRLLAFWTRQLADLPPALELPTSRPRTPGLAAQKRWISFALPAWLSRQLEALSRETGATLFMVLLAAYQALLFRYTGQTDLLVGTPTASRDRPELEGLIGVFINTLVLRTSLDGNPSFRELLQRTQRTMLDAYAQGELPFEKLIEELQPERDLSRPPLFQALFMLQNTPPLAIGMGNLKTTPVPSEKWTTPFDLALEITTVDGELRGAFEYDSALFDDGAPERMVGHFRALLEALAARPETRVADVPLLSAAERAQLAAWNSTAVERPAACFAELFAAQVARSPDALALVAGETQLSYAELDRRAERLAGQLVALGVGPDVVVALLAERGPELLVAILAVLKAGGAYLPLDPHHPPERIAQVLGGSRAPLVLAAEAFQPTVDAALHTMPAERRPLVRDIGIAGQSLTPGIPRLAAQALHLAYVIYTSGSTGVPKGAMVEQRGMINHLYAKIEDLGLTSGDAVAQNSSQCFDISVWQFLAALLVGGRVHIFGDEVAHDPARLLGAVEQSGITTLQVVPSMLRALLDEIETRGQRRPALPALRWVVPTGEALPADLCRRWLALYPAVPLLNAYGSTECSDDQCHHPIRSPGELPEGQPVASIGRPLANTAVYILNAQLQPAPIDVAGELYIGGVGVGRGYLNDPARTAASFIPDPFAAAPDARLYKTGDLARVRADGTIEFLGRVDQQVKLRGYRIELGEIEVALRRHPAVREAVVLAREDQPGASRLVAYVVPSEDGDTAALATELCGFVARSLPAYMVPSAVVPLETLPLTPNGKLDRRALPAPAQWLCDADDYVTPRTPTEELLAQLWAEMLGLPRVSVHANFFQLGGHSLLAAQLMARVRDALGCDLPLRALFGEAGTVAGLARALAAPSGAAEAPAAPELAHDAAALHEPFPLTDLQQAYWVGQTSLFELGNIVGQIYHEYELEGFDISRLEAALDRLIARHAMLRAVMLPDGRQQILASAPPYHVETRDLRGQDAPTVEARLAQARQDWSTNGQPSDLWPLFAIRAHLLDAGRTRLHFSMSLIICDGWSFELLLRELLQLYETLDADLPALGISYRDYALALRSADDERARAYWAARLATLPPAPALPLAKSPASLARPTFVRRVGRLDAAERQALQAHATRAGLTLSSVLCSAYASVLAAWSKHQHFALNVLFANRQPLHPHVDRLVGNFSTTLLLEVMPGAADPFAERTRRLQSQLWADLEHSAVSGIAVVRELGQAQGWTSRAAMPVVFTSLLNISTNWQRQLPASIQGGTIYSSLQTPQVWLDNQVFEEQGELHFNWDAVEELFPEGMIEAMFGAYLRLVRQLATDAAAWDAAGEPLIPPEDLAQREITNNTLAPIPAGLLHSAIAAQADARPDSPAVIAVDRTLTYAELDARARAAAHWLRDNSARPNTLVAVVLEKGWRQAVATLAVLQSGAAYLPLDPALPAERLAALLDHGAVALVLTEGSLDATIAWPHSVRRLCLSDAPPPELPPLAPTQTPTDLAYVIYTSGSTGMPKGVMIDHRGALNTIADLNARFHVGPSDRALALSSLSFDLSVYDIFGTLAAGGALVFPSARSSRDPSHWAELVAKHDITIWNTVPALFDLLIEHVERHPELRPRSLRLAMMSGDWIPLHLLPRARSLLPDTQLYSLGGATEASIWSNIFPIETIDPSWVSVPYGAPLLNQHMYVLNEALEHCPAWVVGEIHIGGVGMAQGYWRDEARTRGSFVAHPRTGERLYKTGDLGRCWPDGTIELLGREDFQVKIQGYRIELGEVEHALRQHPAVREAVVAAQGAAGGEKRLVAYAVTNGDGAIDASTLRAFLQERLPAYMLPSAVMILEALPLSANGKIDRRALPAPELARAAEAGGYHAPADALERALVGIWEAAVGSGPIGVRDGFFEAGGTSIAAMRLVSQIEQQFGWKLALSALFEGATVETQARELRARAGAAHAGEGEDGTRISR